MDIAALSISMSQASLSQQVGVAVAKKVMDISVQSASELTKMLESSVNPNLGSTIDLRV